MSSLEDIWRVQQRIRADMGAPILRIKLGRKQMAELESRRRTVLEMDYRPESLQPPSTIFGVPLWAVPVDDWFRIVREGDE